MDQRLQNKFILDSLYTNVAIKSTEIFQIKIFYFNFNKTKDRVEISSRRVKVIVDNKKKFKDFFKG
jgi:hypothetical protein